jgi:hypothetical protein
VTATSPFGAPYVAPRTVAAGSLSLGAGFRLPLSVRPLQRADSGAHVPAGYVEYVDPLRPRIYHQVDIMMLVVKL